MSKGDGMRGLAVFISDIRNCEFVSFTLQLGTASLCTAGTSGNTPGGGLRARGQFPAPAALILGTFTPLKWDKLPLRAQTSPANQR